jgi:hypothetical protein
MKIIEEIFSHPSLLDNPPVLIDIGASTALPDNWKNIAKYSICIAFDPDSRQMEYMNKESGYKKLYVYPKIVTGSPVNETNFYLTASPECSSTLPPIQKNIENYSFSPFFTVEKELKFQAATVPQVLAELGLNHIDWFKTDTQGTDLRIFKSIPGNIRHKIITAELEPSIADTYKGEDKLSHVMSFMDHEPFWSSDIKVQHSRRISRQAMNKYFSPLMRKLINTVLSPSPCWAELTFFNEFENNLFSIREYLLGCVFAMEERQYGFAIAIAEKGKQKFGDPIFDKLLRKNICRINSGLWFNKSLIKKVIQKLFFLK